MARPKRDPLIAAMIAKLPDDGEAFPQDKQQAWLELMAMAFRTAYGGAVSAPTPSASLPATPPLKPAPETLHAFYIDKSGAAMKRGGIPVKPSQVKGELVDLRGIDGDLKTILWSDGTMGLNGADLTIVAG